MKKIFFSALALMLCAASYGQFSMGYHLGMNISSVTNERSYLTGESKAKTGFVGGLVAEYRISSVFAIQSGLDYSRQGQAFVDKDGWDDSDMTRLVSKKRLNYLNLPLTLKVSPIEKLSIHVGGQVGCLLNVAYWEKAKYDYDNDQATKGWQKYRTGEKTDIYNRFDYGVVAGASYKMGHSVALDVRYYLGLNEIYDSSIGLSGRQNRVLQIGIIQKF